MSKNYLMSELSKEFNVEPIVSELSKSVKDGVNHGSVEEFDDIWGVSYKPSEGNTLTLVSAVKGTEDKIEVKKVWHNTRAVTLHVANSLPTVSDVLKSLDDHSSSELEFGKPYETAKAVVWKSA